MDSRDIKVQKAIELLERLTDAQLEKVLAAMEIKEKPPQPQ
jgi:phage gp16-like protein